MKKIIAAAAGLMIAGTAMVASAAVEFSGDARARYNYRSVEMNGADTTNDFYSHRVRLNIKATNAGGSYAKVTLRMDDNTWNSGDIADNDGGTVSAQTAYIGVPMGCVELTAGRQPLNVTTTFFNDASVDNARLTWANEGTTLMGLYGVINDDASVELGTESDTDKNDMFAVVWGQEWNADWATTVSLAYVNLDTPNNSVANVPDTAKDGVMGIVAVKGQAGPVALVTELGYQEKGLAATDGGANTEDVNGNFIDSANSDDAFGIYATAGMNFDALGMTLVGAYGQEGYVWDAPVGFMIIGGDNQISYVDNMGAFGAFGAEAGAETLMVGLKTTYQATEELGFLVNLGYVDAQAPNVTTAGDLEIEAFELSGQAAYAINDGTVVYARAGYANVEAGADEQDILAGGVSLEIKF